MQSEFLVVFQIDCIVLEPEFESLSVRLLYHEDVEESFVNSIGTRGHLLCMVIDFAIAVHVAQIPITGGHFEVGRFSNDQLAHTVNEEALPPCQ